jgi:DNA polymerase-3 subunit beta
MSAQTVETPTVVEVTVDAADLKAATAHAALHVAKSPPAPILACAVLRADGSALTVETFDYETSWSQTIDGTGDGPFVALVDAARLRDRARDLDAGPVHVTCDGAQVTMRQGRYTHRLRADHNPDDYPALPERGRPVFTVPGGTLGEVVTRVGPAVSREDTLPVLTAVCVAVQRGHVEWVGTDRYRLSALATAADVAWTPTEQLLVPLAALKLAAKAFDKRHPVTVGLAYDGEKPWRLTVTQGRCTASIRLIEATFPRYAALFPERTDYTATLDRRDVLPVLQRVAKACVRDVSVRLTFDGATLTVAGGDDGDSCEGSVDLAEPATNGPVTVGYNAGYLVDALKAQPDDAITMAFTVDRPALFTAGALRTILMHMRQPS